MPFQPLPLETDPDAVAQRLHAGVRARLAAQGLDYRPDEGALDTALLAEIGRENAATNARTVAAAQAAVVGFGVSIVGLPVIAGARASIAVTITATAIGAVIPAGLQVIGTNDDGQTVAFTLPASITTTGMTATATLTALDVGEAWNAVPAGPLTVVTATATVVSVAATGASFGGVDPESADAYSSRLVDFMATLGPQAVRASDVVQVARTVPGVARALAVDLYDATTNNDPATAPAERTVSVFPIGADGDPVGADVKTALAAALASVREVNFVFRVADPTYTQVAVAFTAVSLRGFDPAVVQASCVAALTQYLSPAAWGASDPTAPTDWTPTPVVRRNDLVGALYTSVAGLAYVQSLTLNGGTSDVTLAGRAALPRRTTAASNPSTITGTVTAP